MRRTLMMLALAASIACSKDITSPSPVPSGGLAFGYSGGVSGAFSASGAWDSTNTKAWAGAWQLQGRYVVLAAVLPRSATTHDAVSLIVPRNTPGTATIANVCPPDGCGGLLAVLGRGNADANEYLQGCHIQSGTITIATVSETRVTGTFSGTGACFSNTNGESSFNVVNGAFDLPLFPTDLSLATGSTPGPV